MIEAVTSQRVNIKSLIEQRQEEKNKWQEILDADSDESELFEDTPEPSVESEEEVEEINEASNC